VSAQTFTTGNYLEVVSMSGLQVDFYNDYIGGEVRLAYYHDGAKTIPVTGVSISGKLSQVLENIRFSSEMAVHGGYFCPAKAALQNMTIF
jgi:PmbA protein